MRDAALKGAKLVFFLLVLPAFLTWCHLYFTLQRQGILLVESLPSIGDTYESSSASPVSLSPPSGLYWSTSPQSRSGGAAYIRQHEASNRRKLFGLLPAWPSISQIAASLIKNNLHPKQPRFKLEYQSKYQAYCISTPEHTLCPQTESGGGQAKGTDRFFPPEVAQWRVVAEKGKKNTDFGPFINLRIRSFSWFKSYYFQQEEKPFQQLFQRPGTCLLLALNIGLAFAYWNFRVNPNAVALMDVPILQQFQYWRAITGTLAHFEWWHLLFNMMSLHNLGQFLEEQYYGSINFFLYNLALIPVTVLIFFAVTHVVYLGRLRLRNYRSNGLGTNSLITTLSRPSVNAVGYSGVLFAWMVVSSLEQTKSCPIPFWDSLCFDTWHITKHIKFNLGPMIQLVIAQMILPRVSFGGHLAGIIAGFWLHWNLLPLEVIQPSVLIPLLTLLQWKLRQFIPIHGKPTGNILSGSARNFLDEAGIDDEDEDRGNHESKEDNKATCTHNFLLIPCHLLHQGTKEIIGMSHLLSTLLLAMIMLLGVSVLVMSWGSSILYSQAVLVALFYACHQSYTEHWDDEGAQDQWSPEATQKKQRMLVLWKGYIVSSVLVLIMESMTLSSWILMGSAMFPRVSCWMALSLLLGLILVHLIALSVACKHWDDIGGGNEEKGIFEYTLGFCVLDNAKGFGPQLLAFWTACMRHQRAQRSLSPSSTNTVSNNSLGMTSSSTPGRVAGDNRKAMAAAAAERRARAAQELEIL